MLLDSFEFGPERTPWIPSMKLDNASTGMIAARYSTTSSSLVYIYPHTFLAAIAIPRDSRPSTRAISRTTRAANLATSGLPAPSSLDILVLGSKRRTDRIRK